MTTVDIRTMTAADLDFAASCTETVGWGSQRGEFEGFYAHDPGGCLVAEAANQRIGICIATPYDGQGFLGMLIVVPEARGRGVGRSLLERAIVYLHARGARTIGLDGVLAAVPLYERLGFQKACRSLRFSGRLHGRVYSCVRSMRLEDLDAVCALDREAFGADRRFFLERRLVQGPALCKVLEHEDRIAGFILGRRTKDVVSAGPWVVRPEVEHPTDLLEALAVEAEGCTLGLGVLETNRAAAEAVRALGFAERADSPWRMVHARSGARWPPDACGDPVALGASPMAYAIGSPAKG